MKGGTISDNTANSTFFGGGGVSSSGAFIMDGGKISGNRASVMYGGGVYVGSSGSFKISNGIVYGKDYNGLLNNSATGAGAALYVEAGGTAQWGSDSSWSDIPTNKDGNGNGYYDETLNFIH